MRDAARWFPPSRAKGRPRSGSSTVTGEWWNDDDALLAAVRDAIREAEDVPPDFVEAGRTAFAWHNIDAELAALTYDSLQHALADAETRSATEPAELRCLIFDASELSIELEIIGDALRRATGAAPAGRRRTAPGVGTGDARRGQRRGPLQGGARARGQLSALLPHAARAGGADGLDQAGRLLTGAGCAARRSASTGSVALMVLGGRPRDCPNRLLRRRTRNLLPRVQRVFRRRARGGSSQRPAMLAIVPDSAQDRGAAEAGHLCWWL